VPRGVRWGRSGARRCRVVELMAGTSIPHLAIPLRVTPAHSLAVNEQANPDDLAQCVEVLLLTETGDRIEVPDYGVPPMLFSRVDPVAIVEACSHWEPRATVEADAVVGDSWDDLVTSVVASVRAVS
jgi:phage baseplate assembly protein W